MEDKVYSVKLRSKTVLKLEAATVKKERGHVIFINAAGEETGSFNELDVEGYSVEREPPMAPDPR